MLSISAIISQITVYFLAALACGAFVRMGFLPLHISCIAGLSAYAFAYLCGEGVYPVLSAFAGVCLSSIAASISGVIFLRVRRGSAALASIGLWFLFDRYVRTAEWTGGSEGLWRKIPCLSSTEKILLSALLDTFCALSYLLFQSTAAERLVTIQGHSPALGKTVIKSNLLMSMFIMNAIAGICAGCSGIIITLQMGFLAPPTFSLQNSILYVSVILVTGYKRVISIAVGSLLFSLLPEVLRICGLGNVEASAWRGVIVGAVILCVILLQIPRSRAASFTK